VLVLRLDRGLDRGGEAGDRRDVEGAAADVALLPAAVDERAHGQVTAYDERADAVGATDLVTGEGQRVDARGGEVDRHLPERLHGVGVHGDLVLGRQGHHLVERLERADLVVGPHHRDQGHRGRVPGD
jgi:hypothetical protein